MIDLLSCFRSPRLRGSAEQNMFQCPMCQDDIKTLDVWRAHVEKDSEHQAQWPTEQVVKDAYEEYNRPKKPNIANSLASRKRAAENPDLPDPKRRSCSPNIGELPVYKEVDDREEPPLYEEALIAGDVSEDKKSSPRELRQSHGSTIKVQLRTPEKALHPNTTPSQMQATPDISTKQRKACKGSVHQVPDTSKPSPSGHDSKPCMMRQPETRPISQDQLVAEVKGIYAGLVMVETKCIE
ncbi:hypothetical protein FDECE_15319, partial [Fusarium decemcellulare]